jgi:N-acetylglucosamine-6-phosphate deacetylase
MGTNTNNDSTVVTGINCITGKTESFAFENGRVQYGTETESTATSMLFKGPGLIDLQINGINGIDFNTPSLTQEDILNATRYLLSKWLKRLLPA